MHRKGHRGDFEPSRNLCPVNPIFVFSITSFISLPLIGHNSPFFLPKFIQKLHPLPWTSEKGN